MNSRLNRLSELKKIPKIAQLDHRLLLDGSGKPFFLKNMSRKERRKLKAASRKIARQYTLVLQSLYSSGVGFPVDQTMRQMAAEYTHRYASSGTGNQPVSFNYFEPFLNLKLMKGSVAPYTELTPETNHLFYATDFFDFLTSNDSDGLDVSDLLDLPEAETFHFSNNGVVEEISFFDAKGREYIFSGFSMVRRNDSIHWFLVAGEKLTEEEWNLRSDEGTQKIDIENIDPWKRAFLTESIESTGSSMGAPLKLEGADFAARTLTAGEFDLKAKKHIERSLFIETENSYAVFSDDPEILLTLTPKKKEQIIEKALDRIAQADILWNLAEGFLQLPRYFETRITIPKSLIKGQGKQHGLKGKGGKGVSADYVAVEAVSIEDNEAPSIVRRVSMPVYSTETEGHWRRLKLGQSGKDRNGCPISGKTWVSKSNPWRNERKRDSTIFVKDSLAVAKSRVEEIYAIAAAAASDEEAVRTGNGELYVLRCTLMEEEVYKVGWTSATAKERAKQLSSATGVPLSYVVVESWEHDDPEALETEVHAQLSPYRINNQREFFRLSFASIRKIVITTIMRTNLNEDKS
ncbi:GIY-YIG nuclease family protein [Kiloniella sp. EL199]|uniref:GIY-YIG nuclease family protein n=1 Tax=Kiloniella sp. EL199 TaxID=2107581 RepID=UPI000EA3F4FE|nr:GIY-YIG nuclease family protein [Kiloniella sp. EL199]